MAVYVGMAVMGLGWGAIVSLPFAIFSQCVAPARIGLYMGVFNLSVVLPQLAVSLGVGMLIEHLPDKGSVFLVGAATAALSAIAWMAVKRVPLAGAPAGAGTSAMPSSGGH
jgi:hypothetical protein